MKLKDKYSTPCGGWFYDDPLTNTTIVSQLNLDDLVKQTMTWHQIKKVQSPAALKELVEDQICTRQPKDRCWYSKKAGDQLSRVIHAVAGAIDAVAGTKLERRARGCYGCSKRRVSMNG